jgi:RNA polymerase sigma-70 factor (ECF subfamily)
MAQQNETVETPVRCYSALQLSRILPDTYEELRKLARVYMARERRGVQTLQATALVHEAFLKLKKEKAHAWRNRAHFCAIASKAMREILVERARGGGRARVSLHDGMAADSAQTVDLLLLHEAMERLHQQDPKMERIVELRFFGGLTVEETAEILGISSVTVKRSWSMAKAWLKKEMERTVES